MKHSEMIALAGIIFLARALPRWVAALSAIGLSLLSTYLAAHGN